ncbi:NAD-P-binding protein [Amylocystis lapponica]|nr:NAD-P-binding protein [Amylocystis lapponica]
MSEVDLSIPSLYDVKGKVAVVTGGGSGIGTMIAAAYVQNGARVYIASRKEKQLKAVADALNKRGPGSCHYVVTDLSTKAGCDTLAAAIKERETKIHVLVNNSGAAWGTTYENVPEKEGWDKIMALNVKSIFYCALLTDLLAKDATNVDPGRVINISSIAGIISSAEDPVVAGSNHGLWSYKQGSCNHLTSQLAATLGPRYITYVLSSIFPSKMTAFGIANTGSDQIAAQQPMRRFGAPRDAAGLALFLASPASAFISGAHIVLDGGAVASGKASL